MEAHRDPDLVDSREHPLTSAHQSALTLVVLLLLALSAPADSGEVTALAATTASPEVMASTKDLAVPEDMEVLIILGM